MSILTPAGLVLCWASRVSLSNVGSSTKGEHMRWRWSKRKPVSRSIDLPSPILHTSPIHFLTTGDGRYESQVELDLTTTHDPIRRDVRRKPGSKMSEAIAHPKSHVRAWYSYAFAAEVFSAVGIVSQRKFCMSTS
jgi:hypothetical protein